MTERTKDVIQVWLLFAVLAGSVISLAVLPGCPGGGGPGPQPTPTPPHTESCQALLDQGLPWCESGECGDCVHNPSEDPRHCERCGAEPSPPPTPPPSAENQWFPIVPGDQITAVRGNPGRMGSIVNKAMAELTGCVVGQEPCPISIPEDLWDQAVCKKIHEYGFYCGRHVESPLGEVCPLGGGCSDQISVKAESFCDGNFHENYRIVGPNVDRVRWYPSAQLDAWNVDCTGATWPQEPGPPDPTPPPGMTCSNPDPRGRLGRFVLKPHHQDWDSTFQISERAYCSEVCSPEEPDVCFTGRNNCPMRFEGDPEREVCYEAVVGHQKWWCDGQPLQPNENPAQARCHGHVKTCTEDGSICSEADW